LSYFSVPAGQAYLFPHPLQFIVHELSYNLMLYMLGS